MDNALCVQSRVVERKLGHTCFRNSMGNVKISHRCLYNLTLLVTSPTKTIQIEKLTYYPTIALIKNAKNR
jgi:hypothetical protein